MRTAGFASLDYTAVRPVIFTYLLQMFLGGAPGGTAGGMKTTFLPLAPGSKELLGATTYNLVKTNNFTGPCLLLGFMVIFQLTFLVGLLGIHGQRFIYLVF